MAARCVRAAAQLPVVRPPRDGR